MTQVLGVSDEKQREKERTKNILCDEYKSLRYQDLFAYLKTPKQIYLLTIRSLKFHERLSVKDMCFRGIVCAERK